MIQGAMDTPEAKTRLTALGAQRITVSNEQFSADIRNEYEKAGMLAKRLGTFK
jgi:tripartite-type tricarboxylate transporter receptor subunit TctC